MKLELLLAVVHNDKAAYYSSLIQSHQANLQLTLPAKGTTHLILDYLGLTERPKTMIISAVRADQADALVAHGTHDAEEIFRFGRIEHGGRFVHDEQPAFAI